MKDGSAVASGLSLEELRVLEIARDLWENNGVASKEMFCEWAINAFRNYLAAGCDQQQFIERLPSLLGVLRGHLIFTAEICHESEQDETGNSVKARAEDEAYAVAAQGLVTRMDDASRR